jgi:hypothetical protein
MSPIINATGIQFFVEYLELYRVLFIGHSVKFTLPCAIITTINNSTINVFAESRTLGIKTALGKAPSAVESVNFAKCHRRHSTKFVCVFFSFFTQPKLFVLCSYSLWTNMFNLAHFSNYLL